jgi:hypothetical protein
MLTGLKSRRLLIVHSEVSDMCVSTKSLNRYVRSHTADGLDHGAQSGAASTAPYGIVPGYHKQIDGLFVVDSLSEPRLLNHVGGFDDLRNVAVASEVEKNTKGHDIKTFKSLEDYHMIYMFNIPWSVLK